MPRKQRFKPSRKPKPAPTNEDATMGRADSGTTAHNDNVPAHESVESRNGEPSPSSDVQSG